MCAGLTVYAGIKKVAKPGQTIGIVGIGGLGHLAIQVAKKWGCKVIAFSSSANKEKEARDFGADDFVLTSNKE